MTLSLFPFPRHISVPVLKSKSWRFRFVNSVTLRPEAYAVCSMEWSLSEDSDEDFANGAFINLRVWSTDKTFGIFLGRLPFGSMSHGLD